MNSYGTRPSVYRTRLATTRSFFKTQCRTAAARRKRPAVHDAESAPDLEEQIHTLSHCDLLAVVFDAHLVDAFLLLR